MTPRDIYFIIITLSALFVLGFGFWLILTDYFGTTKTLEELREEMKQLKNQRDEQ